MVDCLIIKRKNLAHELFINVSMLKLITERTANKSRLGNVTQKKHFSYSILCCIAVNCAVASSILLIAIFIAIIFRYLAGQRLVIW